MAAKQQDQEFVEFIVKGIVNNPNDVKVDRKVDEMGVLLTLKVNAEDMGAFLVDETLSAQFKVRPAKGKPKEPQFGASIAPLALCRWLFGGSPARCLR